MEKQNIYPDTPQNLESTRTILDVEDIPSAVLERLIEEVRTEKVEATNAYNRVHNRHNRGR